MPEPRTRPINPFALDFQRWKESNVAATVPPPPPARHQRLGGQSTERRVRAGYRNDDGDGTDGAELRDDATVDQLTSFQAYVNSRPDVDWNTCGQAAIASITDYHGLNPYGLPRVGQYWDDGEAIDAVINGGWGPDVVFGWGTTGGRIRDALSSYGLQANVGFSGAFSSGWEDQWQALNAYVSQNLPVPVLVDVGALGGSWWTAHWPIVYRIEGDQVYLGNPIGSSVVDQSTFLSAWHCWFLPYGFNHCGVYCY
jgi:hypothetical protein